MKSISNNMVAQDNFISNDDDIIHLSIEVNEITDSILNNFSVIDSVNKLNNKITKQMILLNESDIIVCH